MGYRVFSSTCINTNYTYTSDQLKQFNNKQSVSRRIRKTLIGKQIWKPTGTTRRISTHYAKFALVNAQSVRNRMALFLNDFVTAYNIDIIFITETWITQLDTVDIPVLEGNNYTFSHNVRG